jgi:hypothetical protein
MNYECRIKNAESVQPRHCERSEAIAEAPKPSVALAINTTFSIPYPLVPIPEQQ